MKCISWEDIKKAADTHYTLYIDESGDDGLDNLRTESNPRGGPHPLFFFGAYLIRRDQESALRDKITSIEKEIGELHFNKRTHEQKVFSCEKISETPIICFGLISDKTQLGSYKAVAQGIDGGFYNKNACYLLENVGQCAKSFNLKIDSIVFEKRRDHSYARLKKYLIAVKDDKYKVRNNLDYKSGYYHNAENLRNFDFQNSLQAKDKSEEPLLKISDAIANSLYRACVPHRHGGTEYKYLEIIKVRFFCDHQGKIAHHGIRPVMSFDKMGIKNGDLDYLLNIKADDIAKLFANSYK